MTIAPTIRKSRRPAALAAVGLLLAQLAAAGAPAAASATPAPGWADAPTFAAPAPRALRTPSAAETGSSECDVRVPRTKRDRPDGVRGPSVHVVYLVAADFPDEAWDQSALQCSVQAWRRWFVEASGGLALRLDTFTSRAGGRAVEAIDITFVRSPAAGGELLTSAAVEEALSAAGLDDPDKLYLSYVAADAESLCGSGRYPIASLSDPTEPSSTHGRFAQVYLYSNDGCRSQDFGVPGDPRWVEATAVQELLHTEAVTPLGAPHSCTGLEPIPTHVCTPGLGAVTAAGVELDPERVDVMFPFVGVPLSEKVLDRDNDDYFGHSLPLRDLADSPYVTKA